MAATNVQSFAGRVDITSNLEVGTANLFVDTLTSNVGIGTNAPAFTLDVNGIVNASNLYVGGSEYSGSPWTESGSNIYYTTGSVGIGTNVPNGTLNVNGRLRLGDASTNTDLETTSVGGLAQYQTEIIGNTAYARFGHSLGISSDATYAVIGSSSTDPPKIYLRSGTTWSVQYTVPGINASRSVISDDGSYAVFGRPYNQPTTKGQCFVYVRSGTSWSLQATLSAPGAAPTYDDRFGYGLEMSPDGSYIIVGANDTRGNTPTEASGAVHIFERSGSSWTHLQRIVPPSPYSSFGTAVAISDGGSYAIAGSYQKNEVRVYLKSGSSWSQVNQFSGSSGYGKDASISANGEYASVSSSNGGSSVISVYRRVGSTWSYIQGLTAPDGTNLGYHHEMSSDGNTIVGGAVSAPGPSPSVTSGALYVYKRSGSTFSYSQKLYAPDGVSGNYLGFRCAVSGDGEYIFGGATSHAHFGSIQSGSTYIWAGQLINRLTVSNSIVANGTLLSFTGQHTCFPEGPMGEGLIVSANKNKYVTLNGALTTGREAIKSSESIPMVCLSNVANDKSVFGVVNNFENGGTERIQNSGISNIIQEKEIGDNRVIINSLGEGAIWVVNTNGPLETGDYITTSNIGGYGQKQNDDVLHSYTVAKITMDCDFDPQDLPIQVIKKDEDNYNVCDQYGRIQWEDTDQTEKAYNLRYLKMDGEITDQANAIWTAAYVGCTYHCG